MAARADPITLRGSCVALAGQAVLLVGASGRGKSSICLDMIGRGAELVADDRVVVTPRADGLTVSPPAAIAGMIEARGIGILNAPVSVNAVLVAVVDLDRCETARLPPPRSRVICGRELRLFHKYDSPHFPVGILHYLRYGLSDT